MTAGSVEEPAVNRPPIVAFSLVALLVAACPRDGAKPAPASPAAEPPADAQSPPTAAPEVVLGTCRLVGVDRMSMLGALQGGGVGLGGQGADGAADAAKKPPKVVFGRPVPSAPLDKAIIRRVIARGRSQIKYCYEKQLVVDPSLTGTVTVKFTIDASGQVVSATAQGMHGGVAACVANVMRSMRFPQPQGGVIVQVTYPFRFVPSTGAPAPASQPTGLAPASQPAVPPPRGPPEEAGALVSLPAPVMGRGCVDVEPTQSVRAAVPAIEACYRSALERDPTLGGRLFVRLRAGSAGAVDERVATGAGSEAFHTCVADAFASATLPADNGAEAEERAMVCSIGLRNDEREYGAKEVDRVTVEETKLRLGDTVLGNQIEWSTDPAGNAWRALNLLLQALPPEDEDRTMIVYGQPAVDSAAFITNVGFIARETERHHFVYGRAGFDEGRVLLNPLGSPAWSRHCGDVPTPEPLVALLAPDGIWVGTADGYTLVEPVHGEPYTIGYALVLRGLKRVRYQYRSDLEIAAVPGAPYRYLATLIEIAVDTGFFDVALVDIDALAVDPRKLPPRPQP